MSEAIGPKIWVRRWKDHSPYGVSYQIKVKAGWTYWETYVVRGQDDPRPNREESIAAFEVISKNIAEMLRDDMA